MQDLFTVIALGLLASLLALLLKKDAPTQGFLLMLAAIVLIALFSLTALQATLQEFRTFTAVLAGQEDIYLPVLRAVGIAAVVRVASGVCKDAGQSALSSALELAGIVAAIGVCLPLFEQMLALVQSML